MKNMNTQKDVRGKRAKRVMDTNENQLDIESHILEGTKWDEHIRTLELFRLLLKQQPDAEKVNEEGAENIVENSYLFSVVMQLGVSKGYNKEDFISQVRDFQNEGYVTLLSDDEAGLEQLILDKCYDKIQICFNEAQMLHFLLDESINLNRSMKDLMDILQKQKPVWEQYGREREEMEKWHDEISSMKAGCEQAIKEDKDARAKEAEKLKKEVGHITETKVDSQIEEALKLSGKIGATMQDMQKDIIQFMGIFIAIFALLGLNINNAGKWSTADFFHINLVITAAISTLLFLISIIMKGKSPRTSCMGILTAVLWIIAAFVFFVFPYLKDEIISFWVTYYK